MACRKFLGFVDLAVLPTHPCLCNAALQVGWFPTYTITEDYALSQELKMAGFKGRYLSEYLAVRMITWTSPIMPLSMNSARILPFL